MKKLAIFGGEPLFKDGILPDEVQDMIRWPTRVLRKRLP